MERHTRGPAGPASEAEKPGPASSSLACIFCVPREHWGALRGGAAWGALWGNHEISLNFGRGHRICASQRGGRRSVPIPRTREPPRASVGRGALAAGAAPRRTDRSGVGGLQFVPTPMQGLEAARGPDSDAFWCILVYFVCVLLVETPCRVCIGCPGRWGGVIGQLGPAGSAPRPGSTVGRVRVRGARKFWWPSNGKKTIL